MTTPYQRILDYAGNAEDDDAIMWLQGLVREHAAGMPQSDAPKPGWQLLTAYGSLLKPGERVVDENGFHGTVTACAVSVKWDSGLTERCDPNELTNEEEEG